MGTHYLGPRSKLHSNHHPDGFKSLYGVVKVLIPPYGVLKVHLG